MVGIECPVASESGSGRLNSGCLGSPHLLIDLRDERGLGFGTAALHVGESREFGVPVGKASRLPTTLAQDVL